MPDKPECGIYVYISMGLHDEINSIKAIDEYHQDHTTSLYFRAAIFVSVLSTQVTGYSVVILPEQVELEE